MRTEDHPLAYADFEGVIPEGEYGGGAVVVWDRGRWIPEGDPRDGLAKGKLTFALEGEKLRGRWHLVRTRGDGKAESWLLFKGRDDAATGEDVVATRPESMISGRTVEQVGKDRDRVWRSNRAPRPPKLDPRARTRAIVKALPYELTNLDKVLYPAQGLTKADLIAYLAVIADVMLPHVGGRPLMLLRCPDGQGAPCFHQKHAKAGSEDAIVVDDAAGLIGLGQLGALEIHTWGSRADDVEHPDRLVLDLDPDPSVGWPRVADAARLVRALLDELGLESFVTTTGGKGLHVVAPLRRKASWDEHKDFAKAIAEALVALEPAKYTSVITKARRKGKIFVDYLRNGRGATFIGPYSMRAREGAPVATPIAWNELDTVDPAAFTIDTVPRRIGGRGDDPWAAMRGLRQGITARAWKRLGKR